MFVDYLELKLSVMVFYYFRVTLQVSWHPMWKTSNNIRHMCVCVRACVLTQSVLKALWCVFDSQRTPTTLIICGK